MSPLITYCFSLPISSLPLPTRTHRGRVDIRVSGIVIHGSERIFSPGKKLLLHDGDENIYDPDIAVDNASDERTAFF